MVELRPTHPGRQPINERVTITTEVLPNNEISEPHIKLPIQGVLHHKDELPEGRQGLHMGKPKGCGKLRSSSLRTHAKYHMLWVEAMIEKQPESDSTDWSCRSLSEGQKTDGTPHRCTDAGDSHFWELVLSQGHWCWEALSWSPPSRLPAHQHISTPAPAPGHSR